MIESLRFQTSKEMLHNGIIPATSSTTHALSYFQLGQITCKWHKFGTKKFGEIWDRHIKVFDILIFWSKILLCKKQTGDYRDACQVQSD